MNTTTCSTKGIEIYPLQQYVFTKTKGYQEAMLDKQQGRIYHAENVDDMFNQILGNVT